MRFNDAVVGIVLIVFAGAMIAYTTTFPELRGQDYGPDLFPVLIGLGLLGCGSALVVKGLAERSTPLFEIGEWADRRRVSDVALLIGSILFYILASGPLGFIPTAFLVVALLLRRLGSGAVVSLVVAAISTLVLHTVFAKLLLVPLPWGLLQPVAW